MGLYSCNAFAYYTETIPNQCGIVSHNMDAIWTANEHTCNAGQFLPANTDNCVTCPTGATCAGGTFAFNETESQGINIGTVTNDFTKMCADNVPNAWIAVFMPNQHTCGAGYYLPANVDSCTACPANSYCPGGTYTFNENADQGVCQYGYSLNANDSTVCDPNVITITWVGADAADVAANNAGTMTYGGDIRTPVKAQHQKGKVFIGWRFVKN